MGSGKFQEDPRHALRNSLKKVNGVIKDLAQVREKMVATTGSSAYRTMV
jgi:hypothetical protein